MNAKGWRWLWPMLAAIVVGRTAFGYQMQAAASLTPFLLTLPGVTYATIGTLIGAYLLPGVFAALPLGLLGRRLGEERLLIAGLVLMALGNVIPAVLPGTMSIGIGRVAAGLGAVALAVMFGKVLADRFTGSNFVVAMSCAVGAFPLGVGLCQAATPLLLGLGGLPSAFLAGAALAAAAAGLALAGGFSRPGTASGFTWPTQRECGLVTLAGLVWTLYNCGYYGFLSYVPALLQSRGIPPATAGLAVTLATWLNIPVIVAGGALAGRLRTMPVFLVGAIGLSAGVAGIAFPGPWLPWCLLFAVVGGLHPGLIIAAGTLSARPANQAVGMGLFYTVYYAGGTVFPALCGDAADAFGTPAAALLVAAAISLLAIPAFVIHQRLLYPAAPRPCTTPSAA